MSSESRRSPADAVSRRFVERERGSAHDVLGLVLTNSTDGPSYRLPAVIASEVAADQQLLNFLVSGEKNPPRKCAEESSLCTEKPIDPPGTSNAKDPRDLDVPFLPDTGAGQFGFALGVAVVLQIAGCHLVARNRRSDEESAELERLLS